MPHSLKHFNPFMQTMQEAERGEGSKGMTQTRIGSMPNLQYNCQPHAEKGQSIEEKDSDDVTDKEGGDGIHESYPRRSYRQPQDTSRAGKGSISGVAICLQDLLILSTREV